MGVIRSMVSLSLTVLRFPPETVLEILIVSEVNVILLFWSNNIKALLQNYS